MTNNIIKAVRYGRTGAANGATLKIQEEQIEMVCKNKDYELVGSYFDIGGSARTDNRPGLKKMMYDMKDNKFSKIIAVDESRISRNVVEFLQFIKELEKYNCEFETVNSSNDGNGDWKKHWANKLTLQQLERLLSNNSEEKESILANVKLAPVDKRDIEVIKKIFAEYAKGEHSSRLKAGLADARAKGVVLGRPPLKEGE